MRPYVLDDRHPIKVEGRVPKKFRKFFANKKKQERRERRKADRKALRDEWDF